MLKRKPHWPKLLQLLTGGILTFVIALVLKQRGKTLATNEIYPQNGYIKDDIADDSLDQLWRLDLDKRNGIITSAEYTRRRAELLDQL